MEHLDVKDEVLSLIMDECFQQWVYSSEESHGLFWESWLKKYPAKRKDIEEAKSILWLLRFKRSEWSASSMEKVKQSIINKRKGNDP